MGETANFLEEKIAARIGRAQLPLFNQLADLSLQHNAIDLGSGKPDFPVEERFKAAAVQAIQQDFNQYAPQYGIAPLRQGIARRLLQKGGIAFDPDQEVTVGSGAAESLAATLLAIVDPGDEVIIPVPAFPAYSGNVHLAGGKPVYLELTQPGFRLQKERLEAAITSRTKALLLNSPHNPSGRIFSREELQTVAELSQKYGFLVVTDEIYDEIYFGGQAPGPIWQLPGMRERTVIVNGFSKAYSVTGWRLGYVVAAAPLTKAIRKAHHFLVLGSAHPLQLGAVEAISSQEDYYRNLRRDYAARLTVLQTGLDALAIPYLAPEGGYFILADFSGWGWRDDLEFAKTLTSQAGVSARPLSGFYPADSQPDGSLWLRLAFCKQEQVLAEAVKRLQQFSHLKRKG